MTVLPTELLAWQITQIIHSSKTGLFPLWSVLVSHKQKVLSFPRNWCHSWNRRVRLWRLCVARSHILHETYRETISSPYVTSKHSALLTPLFSCRRYRNYSPPPAKIRIFFFLLYGSLEKTCIIYFSLSHYLEIMSDFTYDTVITAQLILYSQVHLYLFIHIYTLANQQTTRVYQIYSYTLCCIKIMQNFKYSYIHILVTIFGGPPC